ncbi:MAG: phosphatase PAP2 family protein [Terriglobales bacterium]
MTSHSSFRLRRAYFVFFTLTILTTTTVAQETTSLDALPDTPSTTLARRFQTATEDASSAQPRPASSDKSISDQNTHPSVLRRVARDQKEIYAAPFHRRNLKWDLLFLAATGGLLAGDKHISGAVSPDHATTSQDISNVGLYSMTASVAGLWLSSLKTHDDHARETGYLAAEAFANTAALVGLTQLIAGRERPTEGNGDGRFWQNNALSSSFPSGHSSFTWTMASVVAHEYPKPWVRWLVYGTATTVSVTRVTGLKHFPSDVEVGGVFGYLIGRQIFNAHCVAGLSSHCHSSRKRVLARKDD